MKHLNNLPAVANDTNAMFKSCVLCILGSKRKNFTPHTDLTKAAVTNFRIFIYLDIDLTFEYIKGLKQQLQICITTHQNHPLLS